MTVPNAISTIGTEEKLPRARGEDGSGWITSGDSSSGQGLPNLCRLLVGGPAPPKNPVHLTLGEDASTSETPNAM
jgi:hypothetical protein